MEEGECCRDRMIDSLKQVRDREMVTHEKLVKTLYAISLSVSH